MSSTIRREKLPTDGYILIRVNWLRDAALSWEARGLLGWLATFTSGEEITDDRIADAMGMSLQAISDFPPIRELEERGYLIPDPTSDSATVAYLLNDPNA